MKKRERNSFLTPLVVEVMPSGKTFRLHHEFTYHWRPDSWDIRITVPIGFLTDFASIPRFARVIIPKLGRYNKAAVIHDAIYKDIFPGRRFTRKEADICFLEGMTELGVVKWKRWVMWAAVRVGGYFAWQKRSPCGF